MRTALFVVTLFAATMWHGFTCIFARLLGVARVPGGVYDRAQRNWARTILWAAGVPVTVEGGDHIMRGQPEILAANHASLFDILALLGYLPVDPKFVAKKELFGIPIFGPAIKAAGHVRMDRQHFREAFEAYEAAAKRIMGDKLHVLVYPEGTRTRTGELQSFKKGPFVLAISCQTPIVPMYVDGAFHIQPRPIRVLIGDPIPTAGLTHDQREELSGRVRDAILALRARLLS